MLLFSSAWDKDPITNGNRLRTYQKPTLAAVGVPQLQVETRVGRGPEIKKEEDMATAQNLLKDVVCGMRRLLSGKGRHGIPIATFIGLDGGPSHKYRPFLCQVAH